MTGKVALLIAVAVVGVLTGTEQANLNKQGDKAAYDDNMKKDFDMFSSIFDIFSPQPDKQQTANQNPQQLNHKIRSIFKNGAINSDAKDTKEILKKEVLDLQEEPLIPYEILLPRTKAPTKIQFNNLPQNFGAGRKNQKSNHFELLNKFLTEMENNEGKEGLIWSNPQFHDKENGQKMPNYKIFGQKEKGRKKHHSINPQRIQQLLKQKVPFLQDGKILSFNSIPHRKGMLLKITYGIPVQNAKDTVYDITARYKPRKNFLEIISLKEKNSPFDNTNKQDIVVDQDSEEQNKQPLDFKDKYESMKVQDQQTSKPLLEALQQQEAATEKSTTVLPQPQPNKDIPQSSPDTKAEPKATSNSEPKSDKEQAVKQPIVKKDKQADLDSPKALQNKEEKASLPTSGDQPKQSSEADPVQKENKSEKSVETKPSEAQPQGKSTAKVEPTTDKAKAESTNPAPSGSLTDEKALSK